MISQEAGFQRQSKGDNSPGADNWSRITTIMIDMPSVISYKHLRSSIP
jgi:hypothetical protein